MIVLSLLAVSLIQSDGGDCLFFDGPRTVVRGQKFHYTIAPAICQEEMLHKNKKFIFPQFVYFAYCNPWVDVL